MRKAEKVCNTYKEMLEYIGLTDRQAKEIYLKHQKKKTFDELAKEYDITRVRIIATCGRTGRRYNPFRDICNDYNSKVRREGWIEKHPYLKNHEEEILKLGEQLNALADKIDDDIRDSLSKESA